MNYRAPDAVHMKHGSGVQPSKLVSQLMTGSE